MKSSASAFFRPHAPGLARLALALGLACAAALVPWPAAPDDRAAAEPHTALPPGERAVVTLFARTAPSVAYITTKVVDTNAFFGPQVAHGAGSGFVWDAEGHVVTNNHVVNGAREVKVQLDAGEPIAARVVGQSPEYDLAVVRLAHLPRTMRPIERGSSSDLQIGQTVYAIGNPFGLQRTLTHGIVSALDRNLPTSEDREVSGVIQTDAAINPGNSGGPLLDSAGRLIGVNTAIRSESGSSAGIGFAIPVDLVNRVVPALIRRGVAPIPGVGIHPVPTERVEAAGLAGVLILGVLPNSPAAEAGLRPVNVRTGALGDVILAVNGQRVSSVAAFGMALERIGIGGSAELTVDRDGHERRVRLRVIDVNRR